MEQKDPIWNFFSVFEQDNKTSDKCIDRKTSIIEITYTCVYKCLG